MHGRPEPGTVVRNAIEVQHRDLADALFQHRDARVDDLLPLLRRLVLRVLAQVAELAGTLDLLRQVDLQLALECSDFLVEPLQNPLFHRGNETVAQRVGGWRLVEVLFNHEPRTTNHYPPTELRTISSRQNPLVRSFRELADNPDPTGERVLLDGVHLVRDAEQSGALFEVVAVAASRLDGDTEEGTLARDL